jgi:hypothetical protein
MKTLHILDKTGDTQFDLETQLDLTTEFFKGKLEKGHMAYEVTPTGNAQIFEITDRMEKVILVPNMVGG